MDEYRHLFPKDTAATEQYVYAGGGGGEFKLPPRDDRVGHGTKLIAEIQSAEKAMREVAASKPEESRPKGISLDICSDPGFELKLESLEMQRSGIELRNSRMVGDVMHATVFVPDDKVGVFIRKFERYTKENDARSGKPKNKDLVESINSVRRALLKSFWMDAGEFPETAKPIWWEVWLREATNPHDAADVFRQRAQHAEVQVGDRELRFPERRVLLARATVEQLLAIDNLFDILAELRPAKVLPGEFLQLAPRDQAELIERALAHIQPPPTTAPAVCHLDTGVNRGHPLLRLALSEQHVLAVDPNWSPTDLPGHGTAMAGLALYGCLTTILNSSEPVVLEHRLESVKILHHENANDPELYGELTSQAVSRIVIAAPDQVRRVHCLTVTADGRDEGFPSSWSAALDQICAGADATDSPTRVFVVSTGNVPLDLRHEYPKRNHVEGIEDPSQSWNALTVGAYTKRMVIEATEYAEWLPIAKPESLSPASRTSLVWDDKSWPIKPEIVMEGGNNAIDPNTQRADYVDDLSLLTTRVHADGAQLTTTADTSAAASLASRYAAIIWARYPNLWPESVRGLLVHSAQWTDAMLKEFPGRTKAERESRLRCYGYGVPDLPRALSSLSNSATLVVEGSLQPFDKPDGRVKTKDMHLHSLPWPSDVLQTLGALKVRMKITLSYFIEPSPGRRGWARKYRYQSHGLRFEVKRPHETDTVFHKRISKAARDEDEGKMSFGSDDREWTNGDMLRRKGSIHSDTWTGTAADISEGGVIAVFPVTGWWKERHHLGRWSRQARYSLLVTIETDSVENDLYTPIANQIAAQIDVPVETIIET